MSEYKHTIKTLLLIVPVLLLLQNCKTLPDYPGWMLIGTNFAYEDEVPTFVALYQAKNDAERTVCRFYEDAADQKSSAFMHNYALGNRGFKFVRAQPIPFWPEVFASRVPGARKIKDMKGGAFGLYYSPILLGGFGPVRPRPVSHVRERTVCDAIAKNTKPRAGEVFIIHDMSMSEKTIQGAEIWFNYVGALVLRPQEMTMNAELASIPERALRKYLTGR